MFAINVNQGHRKYLCLLYGYLTPIVCCVVYSSLVTVTLAIKLIISEHKKNVFIAYLK